MHSGLLMAKSMILPYLDHGLSSCPDVIIKKLQNRNSSEQKLVRTEFSSVHFVRAQALVLDFLINLQAYFV